jgi:hypothetical protein
VASYNRDNCGNHPKHIYVLDSNEVLKLKRILEEVDNDEVNQLNETEAKWLESYRELFELGVPTGNYDI